MQPDRPSFTAQRVAIARAAHQLLDEPRVFDDPIALPIVGAALATAIRAVPEAHHSRSAAALRAFLVARSRYAEESLQRAVASGVRQYIILGAGLDTFAYRNPYPADRLLVFEVDFPATQARKQQQLRDAGIVIPESLRFVGIDFATQTLADRLPPAGVESAMPIFFSWLGVTMYLSATTVLETLRSVRALAPPGSSIVFDYSLAPALMSPQGQARYQALAERVAAIDELG